MQSGMLQRNHLQIGEVVFSLVTCVSDVVTALQVLCTARVCSYELLNHVIILPYKHYPPVGVTSYCACCSHIVRAAAVLCASQP